MTLPPDPNQVPLDNSDDSLGGIDPMTDPIAWLESLAKRQGVDESQLTTSADLDIAMPDANAVVDGPGYTPGYDLGSSSASQTPPPASPAPIPAAPLPEPIVPAPVPQAAPAAEIDPMSDPIAWMESLARRQGGDPSQFTTAANMEIAEPDANAVVDGPGYTPGYDLGSSSASQATSPASPEPIPAAPPEPVAPAPAPLPQAAPIQAAPAAEIDPMTDPIAWMESLARRQGGDPSQFTTAANMEIAEPDANAVVDGPGYTPGYDLGSSSASQTTPSASPEPTPIASSPEPVAPAPVVPEYTPSPEPVRQTPFVPARPNPFAPVQAAPLPIEPPVSPAAPIVPAAPVASSAPIDTPALAPEPAMSDLPDITDPLAWLESLTTPHPESNLDYDFNSPAFADEAEDGMSAEDALAWLDQLTRDNPPSDSTSDQAWFPATPTSEPPLATEAAPEAGGLSNDMTELQKWLDNQTETLGELHELPDDALADPDAPARQVDPNQLPDWLRDQVPVDGPDSLTSITDQAAAPVTTDSLPDWLAETMGQPSDALPMADSFDALPDTSAIDPLFDLGVPSSEPMLDAAAISGDATPAEAEYDPWIAALEEEENRQRAGDESIPDWYAEAITRSGLSLPAPDPSAAEATSQADQFTADFESGFSLDTPAESPANPSSVSATPTQATPDELPAWLASLNPEPEPLPSTPAASSDFAALPAFEDTIPDWLRDMAPTPAETEPLVNLAASPSEDLPDWLRGMGAPELPEPVVAEPPPVAQVAPPAPQPIPQPPTVQPIPQPIVPPVTQPVTQAMPQPIPQPPVAQPIGQPPAPQPAATPAAAQAAPADFDPIYHLQQAQYHADQQNYNDSLGHYQKLIDQSASLDQVVQGISAVVAAKPDDPRARRLLGDAHLRQGNLQAALDTYRSALDRL